MPKHTLPTGFKIIFRKLLKEGVPAPDAMREAWKRYNVQSKRYAVRKSFENPKKRNSLFKKNPQVKNLDPDLIFVSDSQDVQAVKENLGRPAYREYDSFFVRVEEGEYTEVWGMHGIVPDLERQVYKLKLPGQNNPNPQGPRPRFRHAVRKSFENPDLRFKDLKEGDAFYFSGSIKAEVALGPYIKYDNHSYYRRDKVGPLTLERIDSINVKVEKAGESIQNPRPRFRHERLRSPRKLYHLRTIKRGKHRIIVGCPVPVHKGGRCPVGTIAQAVLHPRSEAKRNPIAIYNPITHKTAYKYARALVQHEKKGMKNPPNGKLGRSIYSHVLEIRAWSQSKGFRKHKFDKRSEVRAVGLPDGSVLLRSAKGLRLWASQENVDRDTVHGS